MKKGQNSHGSLSLSALTLTLVPGTGVEPVRFPTGV